MNRKQRKHKVNQLFKGRFHNARFLWRSAEDRAWDNMVPVGREFGSPDHDRLMQQDHDDLMSNLTNLVDRCRNSCADSGELSDPTQYERAVNVQAALGELGHDVNIAVAAAVWRHYSSSLMAGWMSGAETVASARRTLLVYCTRRPTDWRSFLDSNVRASADFMEGVEDLPAQNFDNEKDLEELPPRLVDDIKQSMTEVKAGLTKAYKFGESES